jgi:hypothetical protein
MSKGAKRSRRARRAVVAMIDRIKKVRQDFGDGRLSRENSPKARLVGRKKPVLKEKGGELFGD